MAREERENCCDDCVVELTGDARVYAATLAALEHRRALAFEPTVAATGGSLMKRIRRLLTSPQPAQPSATPAFAAGLLLVTCAAALAAWPAKPPARQITPAVSLQARLLESQTVEPQSSPLPNALRIRLRDRDRAAFLPFQVEPRAFIPQDSAGPMTDKERQAQQKELRKELATPYRKWLNEDVAYIITDAERSAFLRLQTDDEREQFIEQFWKRRDPTPDTVENEFREEHYRRIAYANEHFGSGIPGWKTDRGRIYITYGPPDEIEDHASGGSYQRPASEGGGTTSTFPFQQWRYRFIEGIGNNIIIEFVDPDRTGEFHMTKDPNEKDVPRYVLLSLPPSGQPNSAAPARMAEVFQSSQGLRVSIVTGSAAGPGGAGGGVVMVQLDPSAHSFHISGEVTTPAPARQVVGTFEGTSETSVNASGQRVFTRFVPLAAGSYRLVVVVKDSTTGETKNGEIAFQVN
jgi:GWxTD domain-containing protein